MGEVHKVLFGHALLKKRTKLFVEIQQMPRVAGPVDSECSRLDSTVQRHRNVEGS